MRMSGSWSSMRMRTSLNHRRVEPLDLRFRPRLWKLGGRSDLA